MAPPALDNDLSLAQRVEDLSVEQLASARVSTSVPGSGGAGRRRNRGTTRLRPPRISTPEQGECDEEVFRHAEILSDARDGVLTTAPGAVQEPAVRSVTASSGATAGWVVNP